MKGVIANCIANMVSEKSGKEKWEKILSRVGLPNNTLFFPTQDIDDSMIMKIIDTLCQELEISLPEAADMFGEYWMTVYAAKHYNFLYTQAPTARAFLLNLDNVHIHMTKNIPGAHPPRFEYKWKGDKTLLLKYYSSRGLIDFVVGLAKGVGKYYQEPLKVTKIGKDRLEIVFLDGKSQDPPGNRTE